MKCELLNTVYFTVWLCFCYGMRLSFFFPSLVGQGLYQWLPTYYKSLEIIKHSRLDSDYVTFLFFLCLLVALNFQQLQGMFAVSYITCIIDYFYKFLNDLNLKTCCQLMQIGQSSYLSLSKWYVAVYGQTNISLGLAYECIIFPIFYCLFLFHCFGF